MPAANIPSDEQPHPDYSLLDKDQSTTGTKPRPAPQSERSTTTTSTARPNRQDSQDVKPHTGERGSRKNSSDTLSDATTTTAYTTTTSTDRHKVRSVLSNSNPEATSVDSLGSLEHEHAPRDQEKSSIPTSNAGRSSTTRVTLRPQSSSQGALARTPNDHQHQHPLGATEDTSARRSAPQGRTPNDHQHHLGSTEDTSARRSAPQGRTSNDHQHPLGAAEDITARRNAAHTSNRRPQDAQAPPGQYSEDEPQDQTMEIKQSTPQASSYGRGVMDSIMSFMPTTGPPPLQKDKYQLLKEDYHRNRDELRQTRAMLENCDRELRRRTGELRNTQQNMGYLQHENQRSKDTINGLQNELSNVHQQLYDAKNLSEVRGKEPFGAQVFLTKADTLSISEVGEKVTALNEEIFQAAATLGEALIHERHEVTQTELEAGTAVSHEMVGEKITNILIAQSQKPEAEVNSLLVQVVLRIFMVKFCVSKIQSWYPGDSTIGEILSTIYSDIRSNGKPRIDSKPSFA